MQWVKLGDFIEQCDERNTNLVYGLGDIRGMTITKEVIPTKANLDGNDLSKFLIVKPNEFIYNPRTHGKKIGLGLNTTDKPFLISWNNIAFRIKDTNVLNPEFLYMYFYRSEWDREACFQSWGSSTEVFAWNSLCLMRIPLPSIDEQKQVVAAWRGLKNLGEQNEQMAGPLMDLCQSYLQDLKHKYPLVEIGQYIEEINERNTDNEYDEGVLRGVTNSNKFDTSKALTEGLSFSNYKIVKRDCFAYNPSRINIGSIAKSQEDVCIISPMYIVFKIKDTELQDLLPDFLMLWFTRSEFQRSTLFYAAGSVRDTFSFAEMCRVKIPLPPIEIQRAIVEIYNCARTSKYISETATKLNSDICPALMRQIIGDNQ